MPLIQKLRGKSAHPQICHLQEGIDAHSLGVAEMRPLVQCIPHLQGHRQHKAQLLALPHLLT